LVQAALSYRRKLIGHFWGHVV